MTSPFSDWTDEAIAARLQTIRESWPQGFVTSHPMVKIRKGTVRKIGMPLPARKEQRDLQHEQWKRRK